MTGSQRHFGLLPGDGKKVKVKSKDFILIAEICYIAGIESAPSSG
jgi:hypothetical protein